MTLTSYCENTSLDHDAPTHVEDISTLRTKSNNSLQTAQSLGSHLLHSYALAASASHTRLSCHLARHIDSPSIRLLRKAYTL